MTRRTPSKKKTRTLHSQSFKAEALGLAEKVGVARAAVNLDVHDSQLYDWRQKATLRRSQRVRFEISDPLKSEGGYDLAWSMIRQ